MTWNPSDINSNLSLRNDNRTVRSSSDYGYYAARGIHSIPSGKWYFELVCTSLNGASGSPDDYPHIGLGKSSLSLSGHLSGGVDSVYYLVSSPNISCEMVHNNNTLTPDVELGQNDRLNVAFNSDTLELWLGFNGVWHNSGNPSTGANPTFVLTSGIWYPMCSLTGWDDIDLIISHDLVTDTPPDLFSDLSFSSFLLNESITVSSLLTPICFMPIHLSEYLYLGDLNALKWIQFISDSFSAGDFPDAKIGIMIRELIKLSSDFSLSFDGSIMITDTIHTQDNIFTIWKLALAEQLQISDDYSTLLGIVVSEALGTTDVISTAASLKALCRDTAGLSERLLAAKIMSDLIEETVTAADAPMAAMVIACLIAESVNATDDLSAIGTFHEAIAETGELSDTIAVWAFFHAIIKDGFHASVSFQFPDNTIWETWAVNTTKHHVSVYSGFSFNSYAILNGVPYAAGAGGIYRLSGDTDDGQPIRNGIILSDTLFGEASRKRIRKASFGISGHRPCLKVEIDGKEQTYEVQGMESYPSRRHAGHRITLKLADFDSLDWIEIVPLILVK